MNSKATKTDGKNTTHSLKEKPHWNDFPLSFVVRPFWFAKAWPIWPNCLPSATTLREESYLLAQVHIYAGKEIASKPFKMHRPRTYKNTYDIRKLEYEMVNTI